MTIVQVPERVVRWVDDRQQDRPWVALPIGIIRKYADDRGSAFASMVTYHAFLGLLALLVVVLTLSARFLDGQATGDGGILDTTLEQMPLVGDRLRDGLSTLDAGGLGLSVGIFGLLWTSFGVYHSLQLALNQVWNVPGVERQGFVARHVRALLLFTLLIGAAAGGAVVRTADSLQAIPAVVRAPVAAAVAAIVLLAVLRITVAPVVDTVRLVPAAIVAGLAWEVLQRIGIALVSDRLSRASELYGSVGIVVVALFWINLLTRAVIVANETAVVAWRRLWPRRIAQPPLTDADRQVLEGLVLNERRRPEQHVSVTFTDQDEDQEGDEDEDRWSDASGADLAPVSRDGPVRRRGR
ncbi:YihY/virulence factor BrkB family protein [Iamia sp. SCSIO 61187]|uniref:YihY/virulence factor BrkB family protein n=1 Tax=Iamia sp. SCSIO 61187 TaxID=2722752 RepID=UPI001C6331C7|nr:YhjD/YihY/BrkB family envelope integrity protein [Iamia sp. SCSIO 61187]QYG92227.1 YihY/virulence factor BrkB family protein [Iamia sp. SCSIO 61187]